MGGTAEWRCDSKGSRMKPSRFKAEILAHECGNPWQRHLRVTQRRLHGKIWCSTDALLPSSRDGCCWFKAKVEKYWKLSISDKRIFMQLYAKKYWYCKSDLYIWFRSKVEQLCTTSYCSLSLKKNQPFIFSLRFSFLLLTSDIGKVLYRQWKYRTCSGKNLWNTCNSLFSLVILLLQF